VFHYLIAWIHSSDEPYDPELYGDETDGFLPFAPPQIEMARSEEKRAIPSVLAITEEMAFSSETEQRDGTWAQRRLT
jgi:hypothetical protein